MEREFENEYTRRMDAAGVPDITRYMFALLDEDDKPTDMAITCTERTIADTTDPHTIAILGAECMDRDDPKFDFCLTNAICALIDMLAAFPTDALMSTLGAEGAMEIIRVAERRSEASREATDAILKRQWYRNNAYPAQNKADAVTEDK